MRRPRVRFTVRRLMIAVCVIAVSLAFASEFRRSYLWLEHDMLQQLALRSVDRAQGEADRFARQAGADVAELVGFPRFIQEQRDLAQFHATAKDRYRPHEWTGDLFVSLFRRGPFALLGAYAALIIVVVGAVMIHHRLFAGSRA